MKILYFGLCFYFQCFFIKYNDIFSEMSFIVSNKTCCRISKHKILNFKLLWFLHWFFMEGFKEWCFLYKKEKRIFIYWKNLFLFSLFFRNLLFLFIIFLCLVCGTMILMAESLYSYHYLLKYWNPAWLWLGIYVIFLALKVVEMVRNFFFIFKKIA